MPQIWDEVLYAERDAVPGMLEEATTLAVDSAVMPSASNYTPPLDAKFTAAVRIGNTGDVAAHNCQMWLDLPSGVVLSEGPSTQQLGTIEAGGRLTWPASGTGIAQSLEKLPCCISRPIESAIVRIV